MLLMKVIIILNTLLPLFASIQLCRTLKNSHLMEAKLQANKEALYKPGLIYLLSEDKMLLQRMSRLIIILLLIENFLLCSWSISRILNNFASYATGWITATALIYHLITAAIAQFLFMIYNTSDLSFLKKLKI